MWARGSRQCRSPRSFATRSRPSYALGCWSSWSAVGTWSSTSPRSGSHPDDLVLTDELAAHQLRPLRAANRRRRPTHDHQQLRSTPASRSQANFDDLVESGSFRRSSARRVRRSFLHLDTRESAAPLPLRRQLRRRGPSRGRHEPLLGARRAPRAIRPPRTGLGAARPASHAAGAQHGFRRARSRSRSPTTARRTTRRTKPPPASTRWSARSPCPRSAVTRRVILSLLADPWCLRNLEDMATQC